MVNCIDFSYNVEPALRFHDKLQLIVISFLYIAKLDFLIFAVGGGIYFHKVCNYFSSVFEKYFLFFYFLKAVDRISIISSSHVL